MSTMVMTRQKKREVRSGGDRAKIVYERGQPAVLMATLKMKGG
jgi:hypothetical protein